MGKDKKSVLNALSHLVFYNGSYKLPVELVAVVASKGGDLWEYATKLKANVPAFSSLKILTNKELYSTDLGQVDLVISYLHPHRIKEPYISSPTLGCINFHPAPLPRYRGVACYSRAILNQDTSYGVSCHFVDKEFDTGDIIEVRKFPIEVKEETAWSLEMESMSLMQEMFEHIMASFLNEERIPRTKQDSSVETFYTSIKDIDTLRMIEDSDSEELIDRKARAFFFPPFPGASFKSSPNTTVVSSGLLKVLQKDLNRYKDMLAGDY